MNFIKKWGSVALMFATVACSDSDFTESDPPTDPDPQPGTDESIVDLSRDEMANCYIVRQAGTYKFKADNQFNLGEGLPVPPTIHPANAALVWQTSKGSISSVELIDADSEPYIKFEVEDPQGNALICATDNSGEIVWSWHIWMPAVDIYSVTSASGYEVMNLNLGAIDNRAGSASAYGMLYHWGRKDPFPASASLTGNTSTVGAPLYDIDNNSVSIGYSSWSSLTSNTLPYAIANPTTVLSNYAQYATSRDWLRSEFSDDSLWGNPQGDQRDSESNTYPNSGRKTCYDPSPAGWRVAPADAFRHFTTTGGYVWTFDDINLFDSNNDGLISLDDYNYGWEFMVSDENSLFFPAASRYDGSYAMLMGSMAGYWGNYWSNAPYSGINGGAFCCLSFQVKDTNLKDVISASASAGASRADAFSIRCIRDL